jgi:hypothetical protein
MPFEWLPDIDDHDSLLIPATLLQENLSLSRTDLQSWPTTDAATLRLRHGLLQLPRHTHVFVDDIGLESGRLNAAGTMFFNRHNANAQPMLLLIVPCTNPLSLAC